MVDSLEPRQNLIWTPQNLASLGAFRVQIPTLFGPAGFDWSEHRDTSPFRFHGRVRCPAMAGSDQSPKP